MSSNTSGRVLVAAVVAAALCLSLAGPAQAAGERGISPGPLERLATWFAGLWMADAVPSESSSQTTTSPTEGDEDPEGCRGDYSACLDPNGMILPPNRPIGFP